MGWLIQAIRSSIIFFSLEIICKYDWKAASYINIWRSKDFIFYYVNVYTAKSVIKLPINLSWQRQLIEPTSSKNSANKKKWLDTRYSCHLQIMFSNTIIYIHSLLCSVKKVFLFFLLVIVPRNYYITKGKRHKRFIHYATPA